MYNLYIGIYNAIYILNKYTIIYILHYYLF